MVRDTAIHSAQTTVQRKEEHFEDQHLPLNLETYNLLCVCLLYSLSSSLLGKGETKIMTTLKVSGLWIPFKTQASNY